MTRSTTSQMFPLELDLGSASFHAASAFPKSSGISQQTMAVGTLPPQCELPCGISKKSQGKMNAKRVLEELKTFATYDEEKGGLVATRQRRANSTKVGELLGFRSSNGYLTLYVAGSNHLIHFLVWLWHYGEWPTGELDHEDRDRWNNRIGNLTQCQSRIQNGRNSSMKSNNTSGYNGVSWHKLSKKWMARLNAPHQIYLGLHNTAEEAHAAIQKYIADHPELGFSAGHGTERKDYLQLSNNKLKSAIRNGAVSK
jgi:hypothetical protein